MIIGIILKSNMIHHIRLTPTEYSVGGVSYFPEFNSFLKIKLSPLIKFLPQRVREKMVEILYEQTKKRYFPILIPRPYIYLIDILLEYLHHRQRGVGKCR